MALATGAASWLVPRASVAAPTWVDQRQVGPFICQSAFPLVQHQELLAELPPLERELQRVLAVRPLKSPIYLYLLASEEQHKAYIAERYPQIPYRRALYVRQDDQSNIFAYYDKELPVDLRHECTHALLHGDLPMVPLWLDEGLAEYFEVKKEDRARKNPHLRPLKRDLAFKGIPYISELERHEKLEEMTARDYRHSWAWVHFMLHGPRAAHAELVMYLLDIRSNTVPGSLGERLARAVPNVQAHLIQHFRNL
ncbi:hypothetical protein [Aeoliella mucimassa]|nr:hypothetical protein [Aeoliella mucimassa]